MPSPPQPKSIRRETRQLGLKIAIALHHPTLLTQVNKSNKEISKSQQIGYQWISNLKLTIAASLSDSTELMLESLRMCGDASNEVKTLGYLIRVYKRSKMVSFLQCLFGFGDGVCVRGNLQCLLHIYYMSQGFVSLTPHP